MKKGNFYILRKIKTFLSIIDKLKNKIVKKEKIQENIFFKNCMKFFFFLRIGNDLFFISQNNL